MSLIPSFHKLTDSDKSELIALTVKRLSDSNSYTRMIASQVLAKIGDRSAIQSRTGATDIRLGAL